MIHNEQFAKVRELIDDIDICMFVTQNGVKFKSRPFPTTKVDEAGNIWFFTNKDSDTIEELKTSFQVNLAYSHPGNNDYLSVSGNAFMVEDQEKINELWSPVLKAWFPEGKESENVILIKVEPHGAAYWDASDNKLVELFKIGKALVTGNKYDSAEMAQMSL